MRLRFPASLVLIATATAAQPACDRPSPIGPTPPPDLSLVCPINRETTTGPGNTAPAEYEVPSAQGGVLPVSVSCSPMPGAALPPGVTTVQCTATDAVQRSQSCSFTILVHEPPRLSVTKFLAFGDSITAGVLSASFSILYLAGPAVSYPFKLERLLEQSYPAQTFTVTNSGVPGETTTQGRARLPKVLDSVRPDVLLLLEGVNNVRNTSTSGQAINLREMARSALARNVDVLLATLTPISDSREARNPGTRKAIQALNAEIFKIVVDLKLTGPVDLYKALLNDPAMLGGDGLHPTDAGYTRIAETYFSMVRLRYEVPTGPDPTVTSDAAEAYAAPRAPGRNRRLRTD